MTRENGRNMLPWKAAIGQGGFVCSWSAAIYRRFPFGSACQPTQPEKRAKAAMNRRIPQESPTFSPTPHGRLLLPAGRLYTVEPSPNLGETLMPNLPSYLEAAKPVPLSNRLPWYKTIAPTYLGVMLWFVFWQDIVTAGEKHYLPGGVLVARVSGSALGLDPRRGDLSFFVLLGTGFVGHEDGIAALCCRQFHVRRSRRAVYARLADGPAAIRLARRQRLGRGGAALRVFWKRIGRGTATTVIQPGWWHGTIASVFILLAAFVGLKGIRYVGRVGIVPEPDSRRCLDRSAGQDGGRTQRLHDR